MFECVLHHHMFRYASSLFIFTATQKSAFFERFLTFRAGNDPHRNRDYHALRRISSAATTTGTVEGAPAAAAISLISSPAQSFPQTHSGRTPSASSRLWLMLPSLSLSGTLPVMQLLHISKNLRVTSSIVVSSLIIAG